MSAPCPSRPAADRLQRLACRYVDHAEWQASPFAWMRRVRPIDKGRVGEQLVADTLRDAGADVTGRTSPWHDLRSDGHAVEVKLSMLTIGQDGSRTLQWLQLRPGTDFDALVLVAIHPGQVAIHCAAEADVLPHTRGQHGGRTAKETRKVTVDATRPLPDWLGPNLADDPAGLRAAIRRVAGRLRALDRPSRSAA